MSQDFICNNFTSDQVLKMASNAFLYLSGLGVSSVSVWGTTKLSPSLVVSLLLPNKSCCSSPSSSEFFKVSLMLPVFYMYIRASARICRGHWSKYSVTLAPWLRE